MMMKQEQEQVHETKVISWHEPERMTEYTIAITAIDGNGHDPLEKKGYQGRYTLFSFMEAGIERSSTDPYSMNEMHNSDRLHDFLTKVRQGWQTEGSYGLPWDEIHDGETYGPGSY